MKHIAPGNTRARTFVEPDVATALRRAAALRDERSYGPLVTKGIEKVIETGVIPAQAPVVTPQDGVAMEFAIAESTWSDLRVAAVTAGRSRQGLLRDIMTALSALEY